MRDGTAKENNDKRTVPSPSFLRPYLAPSRSARPPRHALPPPPARATGSHRLLNLELERIDVLPVAALLLLDATRLLRARVRERWQESVNVEEAAVRGERSRRSEAKGRGGEEERGPERCRTESSLPPLDSPRLVVLRGAALPTVLRVRRAGLRCLALRLAGGSLLESRKEGDERARVSALSVKHTLLECRARSSRRTTSI